MIINVQNNARARLNLNVNYLCYALRALFWTLIIINWTLIIPLIFSLMFILVWPINCSLKSIFHKTTLSFYY